MYAALQELLPLPRSLNLKYINRLNWQLGKENQLNCPPCLMDDSPVASAISGLSFCMQSKWGLVLASQEYGGDL